MPAQRLPAAAVLSPEQITAGIEKIRRRMAELEAFDPATVTDRIPAQLTEIGAKIRATLTDVFGVGTVDLTRYKGAAWFDPGSTRTRPSSFGGFRAGPTHNEYQQRIARQKDQNLALLRAAATSLQERLHDFPVAQEPPAEAAEPRHSRRIFIVHGHDEAAKQAVARFLENLGFEPIILAEQPDQGRTIIEKFEDYADVGFAVVLLTPDDQHGQHWRARQNVILELGYFTAVLGRDRVCALKKGEVELPSDILGVLYTAYDDAGAWQTRLAKELQAADYEVDWNTIMRG